jgi:hypothetical protein
LAGRSLLGRTIRIPDFVGFYIKYLDLAGKIIHFLTVDELATITKCLPLTLPSPEVFTVVL